MPDLTSFFQTTLGDSARRGFQQALIDKEQIKTLQDLRQALEQLETFLKENGSLSDGESPLAGMPFDRCLDQETMGKRWRVFGIKPRDVPGQFEGQEPQGRDVDFSNPQRARSSVRRSISRKRAAKKAGEKNPYLHGPELVKVKKAILKAVDVAAKASDSGQAKRPEIFKVLHNKTATDRWSYLAAKLVKKGMLEKTGLTSSATYKLTTAGKKEIG